MVKYDVTLSIAMKKIRVRIAPSPTGLLHIGTVRVALYNYLFAKQNDGDFVLRIEDTDKVRSTKEYEEDIISGLQNLGIGGNEGPHVGGDYGPYRQSERTEIYVKYLKQLLEEDKAYFCACSKERLEEMREVQRAAKKPTRYDGKCRGAGESSGVVRLKIPEDRGDITWEDLIRGKTTIHAKELDDFVIARSAEDPLFHFTVATDDHEMQISHVIRGEDHVSNTPKHILIFEAFGWELPKFGHLPLILNEDKTKMSKRKNKVSVDDYLAEGYLPAAILNFLALLGWNTGDEQEIFSLEELVEKFSLERVHKSGAVFDLKKLDWINGEYIKKNIAQDIDGFYEMVKLFIKGSEFDTQSAEGEALIKKILQDPDFEGRFKKLSELEEGLSPLFAELPDYPYELIAREKFKITAEILKEVLEKAIEKVEALEWDKGDGTKNQDISEAFVSIVGELSLKNGQVLWPIRVALSGLERSPNFATLAVYLGKEEVLKRLEVALGKIEG